MSLSAEPARRRPYDKDLRWRIVYQRIGMHLTYEKIAANLNISTATAQRIYSLFERTGDVKPALHPSKARKLSDSNELYVIGVVFENPALYLGEICQHVKDVLTVDVSPPTVCRLLKNFGITRKKIRQVAKQRCDALRGSFRAQSFLFKRDMFVWVDETGADHRDHIRKFGYALSGLTPTYHRSLARGERVNAIAALTANGILATEIKTGTVNGERFFDFIRGTLLPLMKPFNGTNSHSVMILDNCSVHHVQEVTDLLRNAGIVVLFLPPYSPDLNPAEEAFSFVKYYLKKHDELLQVLGDPTPIVQAAFDAITASHCEAWITHAGYAN